MAEIPQREDRYLRAPELLAHAEGVELRCIAWHPNTDDERVVRFRVGLEGAVEEVEEGPTLERIVWMDLDGPQSTPGDMSARLGDSEVWITHEGGIAELRFGRARDRIGRLVWRARGSASAPTLARDAARNGFWVAWHHDVREDTRTADIAKWIALRFVADDGQVFEPTAEMTDRDRDREGVEQSFEFPRLVVGARGAVALFGRGSHNFWRQDLDSAGFSPRVALSDGEWGSRGRWCAAASLPDGRIATARRERRAITVDVLVGAAGDPPELTPADLDWTTDEAEPSEATRISPGRSRRDPARVHGLHTFFGDIQQHSAHSDGVGSADEAYVRARDRYGDDFVALTDHESFLGKRTSPGEWEFLKTVADRHDAPGRFATLLAYEWTGKMYPGPGHKCVYLPDRDQPLVSRDDVPEGRALVAQVRQMGGMASPHHIGWTGCDEPGHDPLGQPTWEICSCHGCYEHADHPLGMRGEHHDQLADVMLRKGHRFGFTASSDSHGLLWHHGESRKRDPYRTGLTAVQAPELTRDAVFAALQSRRCYATSGVKILLDLTVDGAPMGQAIQPARTAMIRAHAQGVAPLARIEMVGPDGVFAEGKVDHDEGVLEASVEIPAYAYLRVVQEDGEMAWSSPVFSGSY